MVNRFLLLLIGVLCISLKAFAQDTSAYEIQRAKVNALLAERSAKFGQYDESLNARTGIFGFQTKRDIKNSNEILRQITLNDNEIFRELKVLLDYKDLQVEQVKTTATSSAESIQNYRRTIKTLQDQQLKLSDELTRAENNKDLIYLAMSIFIIITLFLCYRLRAMRKLLQDRVRAERTRTL